MLHCIVNVAEVSIVIAKNPDRILVVVTLHRENMDSIPTSVKIKVEKFCALVFFKN